jgi:hypothetical protein
MPLEKRYVAYLLRLWRVNNAEHSDWQASLEDPHNGKQTGFADLASLFVYLKDQTQPGPMDEEIPGRE